MKVPGVRPPANARSRGRYAAVKKTAEGKAPVSKLERRDYLIFSGRSEILAVQLPHERSE